MAVLVRQASWKTRSRLSLAVALVAGGAAFGLYGAVSGGSSTAGAAGEAEQVPATVQPIGNTGLNRVTLSAASAQRLGVQTAPVPERLVHARPRTALPSSP